MTENLTTHERMSRAYSHREPDRVPIHDAPWESTLARWRREGLPRDVAWNRYFDVDRIVARCLNFPNGLENLIKVVRFYEGNSIAMQKVDRLMM